MDNYEGKYSIEPPPLWADPATEQEIIQKCIPTEKGKNVLNSGKPICFEYKEVLNTQNSKNEDYIFRSWILNAPDVLQGAAIMDFVLRENESIKMHRVFVSRNGQIIDKIQDINIRIFDNEQSSSYGTIDNQKKVNCIILDLRLGDIFIQEYTLLRTFEDKNFLDKKYFRFFLRYPVSNWFYSEHNFTLINNREESIKSKKAYFRDNQGNKLPEEIQILNTGDRFQNQFLDHQGIELENVYNPFVELVTVSEWKAISTYITGYYQSLFHSTKEDSQVNLFPYIDLINDPLHLDDDIQTLIEFVQNQIVYLFDAEVMHGYIPDHSTKTIQVKSGDCKAKSFLLKELLKGLGIDSDLILVNYDSDYYLDQYLPSPFVFNHMILKIYYKGQEYFVDSTQQDRFGYLESRSQPLFSNYLPIKENSALIKKSQIPGKGFNIDSLIDLKIKKEIGSLIVESSFFRESADIVRGNFKRQSEKEFLESEIRNFYQIFCYPADRPMESIFMDSKIEIISDDKKANHLKVRFSSQLKNPYSDLKKEKMFRCYYLIQVDKIKNFNHKDALCSSFCFYPIRYTFNLETDLYIKRNTSILKRQTRLDNPHFYFENKKKVEAHKIEVITQYSPKNYDFIMAENLERMKRDFRTMEDSNFGAGVVLGDIFQYVLFGYFR